MNAVSRSTAITDSAIGGLISSNHTEVGRLDRAIDTFELAPVGRISSRKYSSNSLFTFLWVIYYHNIQYYILMIL